MSRFNISYIITAVDKFSGTAQKLKDQLAGVRASMSRTAEKVKADTASIDANMRMMGEQLGRKSFTMRAIDFDPAKSSIERFNKWADMYAFKGFINSMNVIMPLTMLFAKPFKELTAQQQALATLSQSKLNVGALQKQAEGISQASTFSVADVLSSQAILAAKNANQQNIQKIMSVAVDVAAKNNESLKQAVQQINTAIFARSKVSTVGGLVITGASESQRIASLIAQAKAIRGTAAMQAGTMTGQLKQAFNNLNEALTTFLTAATPAFLELAKAIKVASTAITNFVEKHKTLVKYIAEAAIVLIGYIAAQVLLGAVLMGVAMALKAGRLAMILFRIATFNGSEAIKIANGVTKAFAATQGILSVVTTRVADSYLMLGARIVAAKVKTVALTTATLAWRGILLAVRGAMLLLNAAMSVFDVIATANPIGLIVTAIAAVIAIIYELIKHWKTVKQVFFTVCNAISGFIDTYILDPIKEIWHYIQKYIDPAIDKISALAHGVASVVLHPIASTEAAAKAVYSTVRHPVSAMNALTTPSANADFLAIKQQAMMLSGSPLNVHHTTHVHLYNSASATTPSRTYTAQSGQSPHANVGTTHLAQHHIIKHGGITFDFSGG